MSSGNESLVWKRNLAICAFGSFSTVFAMTLMLPFLPLYVEELGITDHKKIIQWSGIAYSTIFITAGLIAPIWGKLGDRYGRKSMLVRASFGMTVMIFMMGFVTNIWQLITCLLIIGLAGGYSSGSMIMIAVQAPKIRSGWALSIISSGVMTGNLMGPLVGGYFPEIIGIRKIFWCASVFILITFLLTVFLIKEEHRFIQKDSPSKTKIRNLPNKLMVLCMLFTGFLLMFSNLSIEPILPLYVRSLLKNPAQMTQISGVIIAVTALGSICSSTYLGKVADQWGHHKVIIISLFIAGFLLIPQAFVTASWQLIILRFFMGLALGGLLPCIAAVIRHALPENMVGTAIGLSVSAQFFGQFFGPLMGGFAGSHIGIYSVFFITSFLMLIGAFSNWLVMKNT